MTIKDELTASVRAFARSSWGDIPDARVVPDIETLNFGNSGSRIDVTVLYADISDSTKMVDALADTRAAEYYKAFLHCASQLIKANGGEIEAYDGDRVMGIFTGDTQADESVVAALQINFAVQGIINPEFSAFYGTHHVPLKFTAGIDSGKCLAIKVGVRAVAELAWIGGAANYAAKLNSFEGLDDAYPVRITTRTHAKLSRKCLIDSTNQAIWEGPPYDNLKARHHYRTRHIWPVT